MKSWKTKNLKPLLASLAILLAACNGGNSNTSAIVAPVVNSSPLAEYKAKLVYSTESSNQKLRITGDTKQQAFTTSTSLNLLAIRVTLFNSPNCTYGTAAAIITMNGGSGVVFPPGTYTSSYASNYALFQRFTNESGYPNPQNASSVRFDYQYGTTNRGPGWVAADCMSSTGLGNYDDPDGDGLPETCTADNPCGFNQPTMQNIQLPSAFQRIIFETGLMYNGDLGGFTGANQKCQSDPEMPPRGAASSWEALLATNKSTQSGLQYFSAPDPMNYIPIAMATGSDLSGFGTGSQINSIITPPRSLVVWTGFTPSMSLAYSGWSLVLYPSGSSSNSCNNWTSSQNTLSGVYGNVNTITGQQSSTSPSSNSGWAVSGAQTCDKLAALLRSAIKLIYAIV